MFFLLQAVSAWVVAWWLIDWERLRELIIYSLAGSTISNIENEIGFQLGLFEYRAHGFDHHEIALIISVSAAPLFAMAFAQGLRPGARPPWLRIAAITAVAMVPEVVGLWTGNVVYGPCWGVVHSIVAYLSVWLTVWAVHRWYHRQPERPRWNPP